ncbi:InlB B-repeat-containing protein, partial [Candidatus Saccharibacteria bacterium]|nr:InlB B-repeat-containing protein [Candidatus Saccharibacteria bacterium]
MSLKKLTGLAIVASVLAVIVGFSAYAKTNIFSVESAIISNKSDAVDGEIVSYDGLNVVSNLTFHKLGDTATYKISLKNIDDVEHYIRTISDNNTNNNLSYLYESTINKTISAGEIFDFVVAVKYSTAVTDAALRTQNTNVSFTIAYDNTEETLGVAPKTGDDIFTNIAIFTIASVGLIVSIILIVKINKKTVKYVAVLMLIVSVLSVVATSANAANTNSNELTINSTVNFRDKVAVTYVIDGSEEIELVDYGSTINKELTARAGYKLSGWTLADGTVFDTNSKIFDDITLTANYTPITFTVAFDGHGARKGSMEPQTFTYDESQNLATNLFKKHGFGLDRWTTTEDGEGGQSFTNEQEISNLTTEDGATVTLYAQWKVMPCNPNATHFDDTVCLQDINPITIETMPYDEQYQLR